MGLGSRCLGGVIARSGKSVVTQEQGRFAQWAGISRARGVRARCSHSCVFRRGNMRRESGHSSSTRGCDFDDETCASQHRDQRVHAESLDLSMDEIAYAGLRDAEQRGSGCLCQTSILDDFSETDHKVSAYSQVLCLLLRETQVLEYIHGCEVTAMAGRMSRNLCEKCDEVRASIGSAPASGCGWRYGVAPMRDSGEKRWRIVRLKRAAIGSPTS